MQALQHHLAILRSRGYIKIWHRGLLQPGLVVADEVEHQLQNAELLIILLSSDYIGGEGEHRREYQWLIAQDLQTQKSIIAVNLRPVSLADCPLSQLPQLPSSDQPVVDAGNPDQAWREVAESVRQRLGLPIAKPWFSAARAHREWGAADTLRHLVADGPASWLGGGNRGRYGSIHSPNCGCEMDIC